MSSPSTALGKLVVAASIAMASICVARESSAQPAPPDGNWLEFAQLATWGLRGYEPGNGCNYQPFACGNRNNCNWVDANSIENLGRLRPRRRQPRWLD